LKLFSFGEGVPAFLDATHRHNKDTKQGRMWFRKADKWPAISILRSVVIGTHRGASVSACLLVTTRCKDEYEQNQIVCIVKEPGRVQGTSAPDRTRMP